MGLLSVLNAFIEGLSTPDVPIGLHQFQYISDDSVFNHLSRPINDGFGLAKPTLKPVASASPKNPVFYGYAANPWQVASRGGPAF